MFKGFAEDLFIPVFPCFLVKYEQVNPFGPTTISIPSNLRKPFPDGCIS
jgi:hypothetical protein